MRLKDKLAGWLSEEEKAKSPERYKLAEFLTTQADDEETAGYLNKVFDKLFGKG